MIKVQICFCDWLMTLKTRFFAPRTRESPSAGHDADKRSGFSGVCAGCGGGRRGDRETGGGGGSRDGRPERHQEGLQELQHPSVPLREFPSVAFQAERRCKLGRPYEVMYVSSSSLTPLPRSVVTPLWADIPWADPPPHTHWLT